MLLYNMAVRLAGDEVPFLDVLTSYHHAVHIGDVHYGIRCWRRRLPLYIKFDFERKIEIVAAKRGEAT
jgi:hypothetical protein